MFLVKDTSKLREERIKQFLNDGLALATLLVDVCLTVRKQEKM